MPSVRSNSLTVAVSVYDVIAADVEGTHFLRHTGLSSQTKQQDRTSVGVIHMAPPLESPGTMRADVVGCAILDNDEFQLLRTFVNRQISEHLATQGLRLLEMIPQAYCIVPHSIDYEDDTWRPIRTRFSCCGFVFEAYRFAGIELVDENRLPKATLDQIKQAYPDYARILDREDFREEMGLSGTGPWPVMFCGYLINSLNRNAGPIRTQPFVAQSGQECFPPV